MANMTELSVRRPVTGVMVFLILTILGVFTFSRLKLDMLPNIEFPIVAVITQYPGAGPDAVEQLVTRPIEEAMASVENVEDVNSTSNQGTSLVMVQFAWGTDMAQAEQDVRKNMEIFALDVLPDDVPRPLTFAFDPAMQPVVFLTLNAPGTAETVRQLAEDVVEPYMARIPGVAAAEVMGGAERQIQVRLKPEWLQAYGISPTQVIGALRGANVMFPGGSIEQGRQELNISTNAEFRSVAQIRDVIVGQAGGTPVQLAHVADVVDTFEEKTNVVRTDGQQAVMIAVRKQSDANTVQVARAVIDRVKDLEKRLPEGASLTPLFDQAEPITRALSNLSDSAILAVFLTALVLLAFLRNWRTSSIVLVSIPVSMLITFAVMDFQGVTLNIISMAGLALAVGMIVDNSIVVLENIFTRLHRGEPLKQASIDGTAEMAMPITASTLTTVAVFAPVLFVPGMAGQLFRDMSLTIVISLLASLLVALTLVPLMSSLMVRLDQHPLMERILLKFTWWLDPLSEKYARFVAVVLRNRWKTILVTLAIFVGSMSLFPLLGMDFMPQNDQGRMQFSVKTAPGTSVWTTDKVFQEVEAIIRAEVPEAEAIVSQFGGGAEGFAALFGQNSYTGSVQVRLPPRSQRSRSQFEIQDVLRGKFAGMAGVEILPQQNGMMMGGGGDVQVKVFADELDHLREYGIRLKNRLEGVEGAKDVTFSMEQGRPELMVEVDREQVRQLGLSAAEVASTISTYFLGTTATMYRETGDEFRVFVRAPKETREDLDKLRALPVITPRGVVPLETVARIQQSLGPTAISRENQQRLATVSVSANNIPLNQLMERVQGAIDAMGEEPGVSTTLAGAAEDFQESFMALGIAFLVAVLLVYMVMASQFESLLEPFVILFAIPLSLAGVVLALAITGTTMQVTAMIGIILLAGVVVNNGIVLVDVLKHRRDQGKDLVEAAIEAGRSRLRPILMTTLTTVLGMLPLAFELGDGAETWAPMARAVIGGMTVSTVLTLVVVPVMYVMIADRVDRRRRRKQGRRAVVQPVEPAPVLPGVAAREAEG